MGVLFKNNASSTLASAIGTSDTAISVASGEGLRFPTTTASDYFYLTLEDTTGAYEVVKVTTRSNDNMTVVRGQDGTNAFAFGAGALVELRVTAQGLIDNATIDDGSLTLEKLEDISTERLLGRDTSGSGEVETLTATTVFDWIGATQGDILYRGASEWQVLSPGTVGDVLTTGGTGADPEWTTGALLTDGDKGDITVSSSGATWALDNSVVTLAKMANLSQYNLIGRSSSGSGVPEAVATSADVYAMLGSANDAAIRSNIGLDTMATQAATSVAITGGTASGLSELQGTMKLCTNTSGTLALADANTFIPMTGNVTFNGNVFSARQAFLLYAGASSRTVTQGSSMTLRLGGTSTTGSRTMAAYTLAVAVVISATEIVIVGDGVT